MHNCMAVIYYLHFCEILDNIFDPFYRVREISSEGNGIGLTLAKLIVERHGGRIWLDSVKGSGSTYFLACLNI